MSVETQLKTGIAESLLEPLMKIMHKLLISDKSTFEQLTPSEQTLWTRLKTEDIYLKFCLKPILKDVLQVLFPVHLYDSDTI